VSPTVAVVVDGFSFRPRRDRTPVRISLWAVALITTATAICSLGHGLRTMQCLGGLSLVARRAVRLRYTQADSDVTSMPAVFRRHLVGKALINVFQCDSFVGKIVDHKDIL